MTEATTTRGAGDQTAGAAARPCDDRKACPPCPWRLSNRGKPHPDDWYAPENLERLWQGVRDGEPMSCHPTDPSNPVTPEAQAAGYRPAPAGAKRLECIGAVVAAQRELQILDTIFEGDYRAYRRARPAGLTKVGAGEIVSRLMFGHTPLAVSMPRPDLNHPDLGGVDGLDWPDQFRKEGEPMGDEEPRETRADEEPEPHPAAGTGIDDTHRSHVVHDAAGNYASDGAHTVLANSSGFAVVDDQAPAGSVGNRPAVWDALVDHDEQGTDPADDVDQEGQQ